MIYLVVIICLIILLVVGVTLAKRRSKKSNYLYGHYECPNYFGPHGDSLRSIFIEQTLEKSEKLMYPDKPEWEVIEKTKSDPEGACAEYIKIKELRNNRSVWEYHICWIDKFEWLLQFDLPRMLSEKEYFNEFLSMAEAGDPDAQTIIGSSYAHCLNKAEAVITPNEEKALYWWNKAAEQGHRYAMMELAIYYLNKKDIEKAIEWNDKGECRVHLLKTM